MSNTIEANSLFIVVLAHEYPEHFVRQDAFEDVIRKLLPNHFLLPGIQKLLAFNRRTEIESRPTIFNIGELDQGSAEPPPIAKLSRIFRTVGVDLVTSACQKAIHEARISVVDITHTVGVTCTDMGSPGYDLLVCQKLQLRASVGRTLLQGVGCAGGLSALRTAANIAAAAAQRKQAASILVFACELCSLFMRCELEQACQDGEQLHIAPALFSDAAAALVVCNGLAVNGGTKPVFELLEWGSMVIPGTVAQMSYLTESKGMIASITKDVPRTAVGAVLPMFEHIRRVPSKGRKQTNWAHLKPSSFDWAIHPGGAAILEGAKQSLGLTNDHIRASLDVYQSHGNSSSPTVLIVLDKMRHIVEGRNHIVATSFGPGMMIEMSVMSRFRGRGWSGTGLCGSKQPRHFLSSLRSRSDTSKRKSCF